MSWFITFLIADINVYILSDSIAKHVSGILYTAIHSFPGINIARLTARICHYPDMLSRPYTIIHVGTNDIHTLSVCEIMSGFNNLITTVRSQSSTHLILSSILPRPVDHNKSDEKVKEVNRLLKLKCLERNVQFICSYRPFF